MKEAIKILFIGDVFGKPGRNIVVNKLNSIISQNAIDFTILNGENSAGGLGITPELATQFFNLGVDVITSGNHIWSKKDIYDYLNTNPKILRPANYPDSNPGRGYIIAAKSNYSVAVINLLGRVFIPDTECPFRKFDAIYENIKAKSKIIFIDFHAEATSEKYAFGYYAAGRASAVIGTHTHVQTNDARIFNNHTAYITDAGMTGPFDNSIIGVEKDLIIKKFLSGMPVKFEVAECKQSQLNSVIVTINLQTGAANKIEILNLIE